MDTNGSKPTWVEFTAAMNAMRAEVAQGFTRLEHRVRSLEMTVAEQRGSSTFARWVMPALISLGLLVVGLIGLVVTLH